MYQVAQIECFLKGRKLIACFYVDTLAGIILIAVEHGLHENLMLKRINLDPSPLNSNFASACGSQNVGHTTTMALRSVTWLRKAEYDVSTNCSYVLLSSYSNGRTRRSLDDFPPIGKFNAYLSSFFDHIANTLYDGHEVRESIAWRNNAWTWIYIRTERGKREK